MPTPTYTPLATVTLGSSASSVTFSSIPATYRDLILVFSGANTGTNDIRFRLNADTGSNYSAVFMRGTGGNLAQSGSFTDSNAYLTTSNAVSTDRVLSTASLMDYSATDKHTTMLVRSGYSTVDGRQVEAQAIRWANTAAVTTIAISTSSNQLATGTVISLYGVIA
jgi:hypothetical protein